jgi:glycerol uptake facilitator-like aquaporin
MYQKLIAEFLGTAFLLMIVVGSGIMGETLASGNEAITLLANSLATGFGLFVLIQCLGPLSGAHFNPIVTLMEWMKGRLKRNEMFNYWMVQVAGAIIGVWLTHFIFKIDIIQVSTKERFGLNLWISEIIASFGLISTIVLSSRKNSEVAPVCIASYVTAAYWFTSSTSFSNPAVTIARMFTNTFCGIAPNGAIPFIIAQLIGMFLAVKILNKVK